MLNYEELLGQDAKSLLEHKCEKVPLSLIKTPNPNWVDQIFGQSDRSPTVLKNFQRILNSGRLAKTGFVSIFPVDQGVEHSAGASFASNPVFFDPEKIVEFAVEAGCNGVASTLGVFGPYRKEIRRKNPAYFKTKSQ